jgi:NADPH:quinone reductase-like Zn-dependent oxidoreductase
MAAWLALARRAQLAAGENVLILGATGASGRLAVQIAKLLGAGRVVAAGRNRRVLETLRDLGADATVPLDGDLAGAIDRIDVIIDYLWGSPTERVLAALARTGLTHTARRVRLIQVGESAGAHLTLPAGLLRGSGLEIYGSGAGTIPIAEVVAALPRFIELAASEALTIAVHTVPLADVQEAWERTGSDRRTVLVS